MAAAEKQARLEGEAPAPVSVAYSAAAGQVTRVSLAWHPELQVAVAVQRSGLLALHPEIDLTTAALGVWGRRVQPLDWVKAGDRIEIYRPLTVDPKEARRVRYRAQGPKRKPLQPRRPRPDGGEPGLDIEAPSEALKEAITARTPSK